METWFIVLISLCISALIKASINLFYASKNFNYKLPPGPLNFPIVSDFLLTRKSLPELETTIQALHRKFGPIITLQIGFRPAIFIADGSLAYQALIQNGAVFSDRPPASAVSKVTTSKQHNINSAGYGPTWRLLRRNLTSEILHHSRVKSYSHARKWVLQILFDGLNSPAKTNGDQATVKVIDHFQFAMFCLLVLMCFGDKLDERKIREIEGVQCLMLMNIRRFSVLNFWPRVTKFVFRKLWDEFLEIRKKQEGVFLPLIKDRRRMKEERINMAVENKDNYVLAYVDTLFDLQLPKENRKLKENEIMSLCTEFVTAGTETTSTALQWVMANLVKYPGIQEKVFKEIKGVVGDENREVTEDDLQKLPYLKAVVLESLRRHPPSHFVLPHAVTEDMVFDGFLFPKNASINFMVAEMGLDSKVWDDPMSFKPERFFNGHEDNRGEVVFDITGSKEIKMMPFGVGRRICPGLGLAMLHLEYFVANLIWCYEWKAVDGAEVDLEEKLEFTMVMKTPLQAHIYPRSK